MNRILLTPWLALITAPSLWAEPVNFSRDVLPVLSDNCLSCHGQDESHRKADLRLDTREGALMQIKVGKPDVSELIVRIVSDDEDELMPPPKSHKPRLKPEQVTMLKRWISEGAVWGKHWSFELAVKAKLTDAKAHPVDDLVTKRLTKDGLSLAPRTAKHTLIRRASFDLIGLPPTPEEVAAFENDASPDAFAKVVKRLLDSPHFGERMAMWWLDAARYSDTDGF